MDNEEEEKENLEFPEYALPSRMEKNFYRSICLKDAVTEKLSEKKSSS